MDVIEVRLIVGGFQTTNIPAYWNDSPVTAMLLFSQIITVAIFGISFILLIAAAVMYVPLLCYIQGNLKVSSVDYSRGPG